MSPKMECHSKLNVTKNGMYLKWNVTQKGMSLKKECHSKLNIILQGSCLQLSKSPNTSYTLYTLYFFLYLLSILVYS